MAKETYNNLVDLDVVKSQMNDYAENATVHGIKYFVKPDRTIADRVFWIIVFVLSMILTVYFIVDQIFKWRKDEIDVSIDNDFTLIWKIPFPAISICTPFLTKSLNDTFKHLNDERFSNEDKGRTAGVGFNETFLDKIKDNRRLVQYFDTISQTCGYTWKFQNPQYYADLKLKRDLENGDFSYAQDFLDMLPSINEIMTECSFGDIGKPCDQYFAPVLHEAGLCYTFNPLQREDMFKTDQLYKDFPFRAMNRHVPVKNLTWNFDNGYKDTKKVSNKVQLQDSYPFRIWKSGIKFKVKFNYSSAYTVYPICKSDFSITFHSPAELPNQIQEIKTIPIQRYKSFKIKPEVSKTKEETRRFSADRRNCFYSDERKLSFFKNYTEKNCYLECFTKYINETCNCVPFYLVQGTQYNICTFEEFFQHFQKSTEFYTFQLFDKDNEIIKNCDCKPNCNSVSYTIREFDHDPEPEDNQFNVTKFEFEYETFRFKAVIRKPKHDFTTFISEIGGLLGLCLGISTFSVFELLYYLWNIIVKDIPDSQKK